MYDMMWAGKVWLKYEYDDEYDDDEIVEKS